MSTDPVTDIQREINRQMSRLLAPHPALELFKTRRQENTHMHFYDTNYNVRTPQQAQDAELDLLGGFVEVGRKLRQLITQVDRLDERDMQAGDRIRTYVEERFGLTLADIRTA